MRIVVVTPTFNERRNIARLITELEQAFQRVRHEMHILVVDDESPDGTAEVVRREMAGRPYLHLLSGPKRGLGVAYARALTHALDELGADAVLQMDADFSHNPADVPRLIAALEGGADFVIGSRYVRGGRTVAGWGVLRRGVSLLANLGARVIAGLYPVRDCTTGFRAIRAPVLRQIDLDAAPTGYAILMYLIYQALRAGARVEEVPVTFANRDEGQSKLRLADVLEFFVNVWWIRYDRREAFGQIVSRGTVGIAVNLAALSLLHGLLEVPALMASALSIEIAILASFAWSRLWNITIRRRVGPDEIFSLATFQMISVPPFLLTFFAFLSLTSVWDLHFLAAQALGIGAAAAWNYFLAERFVEAVRAATSIPRGVVGRLVALRPPSHQER